MRRPLLLLLLVPLVGACGDYRITTTNRGTGRAGWPGGAPASRSGPSVYCGKTAEQWAKVLRGGDREETCEACRALHVLGREGREHLFQGLDSANPETRRLCLTTLTIADFKKLGDSGRQKLVKLAGDRDDFRIRERATQLLGQWHGSIPAP